MSSAVLPHYWWYQIKHFKPNEFSHPKLMRRAFMLRLEAFRIDVGSVGIITSSNSPDEEHAPNSEHYHNQAVNILFPTTQKTLLDLTLCAMRYFSGVGLYPSWKYHERVTGGFHVEYDPTCTHMKQWLAVPFISGKNNYMGLTQTNLAAVGVI
jgi:hypothetical protein